MMLRRKCKINKHWITDAEDRTVIVEKDKPTLTTCYPFNYIGDAPDRFFTFYYLKGAVPRVIF
ncbi:TPA: hypothetical protein QC116_002048 [Bacillus thuringiensis]|nr:hypothetical protein [Bacillus thuringiensis]